MGLGGRGEDTGPAALVAAERAGDEDVALRVFGVGFEGEGEDGVGAALDERRVAFGERRADRVDEADGLTQVRVPVVGVESGRVEEFAGDRRVERDRARTGSDAREGPDEIVPDGFDVRGVGGVVGVDAAGADLLRLAEGDEFVELLGLSRDDRGRGAVADGDRHAPLPGRDQLLGLLLGHREGDEATAAGAGEQDLAAQRDNSRGVLQGEGACDDGRGDLALGVTDDGGRFDAEGTPHGGEGDHHREQGGLHDVGAGDLLLAAQQLGEGPADVRGEGGLAVGDRLGEHVAGRQEFGGHADPLRTLARKDEHRTLVRALSGDDAGSRGAGGEGFESGPKLGPVAAEDQRAVFEGGPLGEERVGHLAYPRKVVEACGQAFGLGAERGGVAGGEDERHDRREGRCRFVLRVRGRGRRLFEHQVRVGAADAEGGDGGASGPGGDGPVALLGEQFHLARRPVHVRRGHVDMKRPGQDAVA